MNTRGRKALALIVVAATTLTATPELTVDGAGWLRGNRIERTVRNLSQIDQRDTLDANTVEDAVFFTLSAMAADGFLRATVTAEIERQSGERFTHVFDRDFTNLLPRPLAATALRLRVEPGVRYRFETVSIAGGEPIITEDEARALMVPSPGLLRLSAERVFTPDRLRSGLEQIEVFLRTKGYAQASARVTREVRDDETGAVDVEVQIAPGPRWSVEAVEVDPAPDGVVLPAVQPRDRQWWTTGWQQDVVEQLRQAYFEAGYMDVRLQAQRDGREQADGTVAATVRVAVTPGPQVIAGPTVFTGDEVVTDSVLRRRVSLAPGEALNPAEVESTRRRLSRLRAFSRIGLEYRKEAGDVRSPVFELEARPPWESSLLLGYGSYEQVRGGLEVRGFNLLRRSHQMRLEAIGSLKSLRGDLIYTVPDLFGETVDAKLRLFGLDREELSFQRQEYGATVSLTRRDLPWIEADFTTAYTFQDLRSRESDLATRAVDLQQTTSASLTVGLSHDGRDNPLMPRSGVRWFAQVEAADPVLGGESGFQRLEAGWSWHKPVGEGSWVHVGLHHGTVLTLGQANDRKLPTNKRFFPGGEHSLRGMTNGEAAPRDAAGEFIGAKSFTLFNLEVEQALTRRISAVLFYDALGETARVQDRLWDVQLHTVGAGLRYQTLIGPIRLEYGHNLNPRPADPSGTVHLSIGYPF